MKKILLVLLFAFSLFAGENNIPKGIGDIDGAVYTADGKTLYTLKNETVTKWSVEPLKQLDTFETTVNHLRDYVSEDIDKNYLEALTKDDKSKPLVLNVNGEVLSVASRYISETWNLKSRKRTFGGVKGIRNHIVEFNFKTHRHLVIPSFTSSSNYTRSVKPLRSIKMSGDNVPYYEIYFNPNIRWKRSDQLGNMVIPLMAGVFSKDEITTILTMTDDVSLTYHSLLAEPTVKSKKEVDIVATRVFLAKTQPSDPYAEVWKSKNAHEAMVKLYGTTISQAFVPNDYQLKAEFSGYSMKATYGLDFTSFLISNSLEKDGVVYPMMILHSDVIDMKSQMKFALLGHQAEWAHGSIEDMNFTLIGRTKDQKVYEWNTVVPGHPGDL